MEKKIPEEIEKLAEEFSGSYWNYRWIKKVVDTPKINDDLEVVEGETEQEVYYELHEVYYDKEEKPFMWTEEPVRIYTENAEELMELIGRMLDAAIQKVLFVEDDKIREIDEYMNKSEILGQYKGEKKDEKETRRN